MNQPLTIGPYEAGEFVARDAHASVCRVVDPKDGRTLTAKLCAPTGGPDARLLSQWHEEFADEARRLRLHGSDLVPIEATGRAGDLAWVVMDIPPGEFLAAVLGDQPLSTDRARAILGGMAAALDRLHGAGLVHRSLKPSNVIIANDGAVLFLDTLLLGRFAEAVVAGALSLDRVTCTAPEVVLGYRQQAASNRYSLAVLAYRALTGVWPYAAGNAIDYAYACVYQEVAAPSSCRAGLSPQVDAILARGLAKEPEDRYPTCGEFVRELDEALRQCEQVIEAVAADPAAEGPVPEWFEPATTVLELVPEPLPERLAPLRAVSEPAPRPEFASAQHNRIVAWPRAAQGEAEDVEVEHLEIEPLAVEETDVVGMEVERPPDEAVAPAMDLGDVGSDADERLGPLQVVMPEASETGEFEAVAVKRRPRSTVRGRLRALSARGRDLVAKLTTRVGSRRIPDHLMREAYLADWRGDAARSMSGTQEWTDPITPEWTLAVQPSAPGWLRIDGRYAGPAPAEIAILGRSGKRVLVELMRDGVAVATTELKLHPLMAKTWEPQESS